MPGHAGSGDQVKVTTEHIDRSLFQELAHGVRAINLERSLLLLC
jgi:hypothetical protein